MPDHITRTPKGKAEYCLQLHREVETRIEFTKIAVNQRLLIEEIALAWEILNYRIDTKEGRK